MDPQSFSVFAGESVSLPITVTDSAGAAVNITGATIRFAILRRPLSSAVASTESSPPEISYALTTPASGLFTVTIAKAITAALLGTYYWIAEVEDSSGNVTDVAHGFITFRAAST